MAIHPSPRFAITLLSVHVVVIIVVCLVIMPLPVKSTLLLLVVLNLTYYLLRDVFLLLPNSWREVALVPDRLLITVRDRVKVDGQIAERVIVTPYFVVLRANLEGQYFTDSRVIFPDALDKGAFRELCVLLKFL